jgi:hypothetical protein
MTNDAGPITPSEAASSAEHIPSFVFDAVNALIKRNLDGCKAVVKQDDIVQVITRAGWLRHEVFEHKWLNFERAYEAAGWRVTYEKPGFNEAGQAFFTFEAK